MSKRWFPDSMPPPMVDKESLPWWQAAAEHGDRRTPSEYLFQVLEDPTLSEHYQIDPAHSWVLAAKKVRHPALELVLFRD